MASKFKVDLSGAKTFFFEKGDKLALALCLAATGVLAGYGILNGMGAGSAPGAGGQPYAVAINNQATLLRRQLEQGKDVPPVEKNNLPNPSWVTIEPSKEPMARFIEMGDNQTIKRLNPKVLAPRAGTAPERREVQVDYVRGTYFANEIDHGNNQIWIIKEKPAVGANPLEGMPKKKGEAMKKGEVTPTIVTRPVRMVVVHMVFPLRDQLVEFQRAFRMKSLSEVFESKDLPRFLGINVWKSEGTSDKPDWKPLIVHNPKSDKVQVTQAIRQVLREAFYDNESVENTRPYLIQGMATPLPKLAILPAGSYPEVKLAGMDFDWDAGAAFGGTLPQMKLPMFQQGGGGKMGSGMQGMAAGAEVEFIARPWRGPNLPPEISEKLNDQTYALDPVGINPDPDHVLRNPTGVPTGNYPSGQSQNPYQGGSPFASHKFWEGYPAPPPPAGAPRGPGKFVPRQGGEGGVGGGAGKNPHMKPWDGLIRFFDPEVKPGKTYRYMVQVRMANPNFNKRADVAFPALAAVAELQPSEPVETPAITIPEEFNLYAVDQKPEFKVRNGSDMADPKSDQVAIQIHRWVDESVDPESNVKHVVGDWAIAERLLVRRGQPVGRVVNIEVPVWKKEKNGFELGVALEGARPLGKLPPPGGKKLPMAPPAAPAGNAQVTGTGIPIDFSPSNPPPMLVDFDGGKRDVKLGSSNVAVKDESASNLLILQADGKLVLRNNRADSDPSTAESALRLERLEQWKKKTKPFRNMEGSPGGGNLPGVFPGLNKKDG